MWDNKFSDKNLIERCEILEVIRRLLDDYV